MTEDEAQALSPDTSKYNRDYYASHRLEIAVKRADKRAQAAGVKSTLTVNMFSKIVSEQGNLCARCGSDMGDRPCVDHKKPYSSGGDNTKPNTQALCRRCFSSKAALVASGSAQAKAGSPKPRRTKKVTPVTPQGLQTSID